MAEVIMHNYAKLRGKIAEVCGSQSNFADAMGLSPTTLSLKMNSKSEWTQQEMREACKVLNIELIAIPDYFFAE